VRAQGVSPIVGDMNMETAMWLELPQGAVCGDRVAILLDISCGPGSLHRGGSGCIPSVGPCRKRLWMSHRSSS
jgi:hypothetical protein